MDWWSHIYGQLSRDYLPVQREFKSTPVKLCTASGTNLLRQTTPTASISKPTSNARLAMITSEKPARQQHINEYARVFAARRTASTVCLSVRPSVRPSHCASWPVSKHWGESSNFLEQSARQNFDSATFTGTGSVEGARDKSTNMTTSQKWYSTRTQVTTDHE